MAVLINRAETELAAIISYAGRVRNLMVAPGLTTIDDNALLLNATDDLYIRIANPLLPSVMDYFNLSDAIQQLPAGTPIGTIIRINDGMLLTVRANTDTYHITSGHGARLAIIYTPFNSDSYLTVLVAQAVAVAALNVGGGGGGPGTPGRGIASTAYNASTGVLTFTFTDSTTYSTNDLRGPRGIQGNDGSPGIDGMPGLNGTNGTNGIDGNPGANGRGIASTAYNASTGVLTFTFTDSTTYSTNDLRGAVGARGADGNTGANGRGITSTSYSAETGVLTINFSDSTNFVTGDLRGAQGVQGIQGNNGTPGADGANITVLGFAAADTAGYNAAVAANAANPRTLVLRYST